MKTLSLLCSIIVFIMFTNQVKANEKKLDWQRANKAIAGYMNAFSGLNEMIDKSQRWGLINREDATRMKEFLIKENVPLDVKVLVTVQGDVLMFGKRGFSFEPKQGFKNLEGVYVKANKYKNDADLFIAMFKAQTLKSTSALFHVIEPAHAASTAELVEAGYSALGTALTHVVAGVVDIMAPIAISAALTVGGGIEGILWLPRWILEGSVSCVDKKYVVTNIEPNLSIDDYKQITEHCQSREENTLINALVGHSDLICKMASVSVKLMESTFQLRNKRYDISKQRLEKIFSSDTIPPCTKENAAEVAKILKQQLSAEREKAFVDAMKESFGKEKVVQPAN